MWVIQVVQFFTGYALASFAIYPRQPSGLIGILAAPFSLGLLSRHFEHDPITNFSWLVSTQVPLIKTSILIAIITGGLVWLLGRPLSRRRFRFSDGIFWFLLSYVFFARYSPFSLVQLWSFFMVECFSLLDFRPHVSFESHIFGFVAGLLSAWMINQQTRKTNT